MDNIQVHGRFTSYSSRIIPIYKRGKRDAETHAISIELKIAPALILPVTLWNHHEHAVDMANRGMIAQMNSKKKPSNPGNSLRFSVYMGTYCIPSTAR